MLWRAELRVFYARFGGSKFKSRGIYMKKAFAFLVLGTLAAPLPGSGPYSPVRVVVQRDERYEKGRALFVGELKLGAGADCVGCHTKDVPLNHKKLQAVRYDLSRKVEDCVHYPDRVNGSAKPEDTEALVYYLAKRYRL